MCWHTFIGSEHLLKGDVIHLRQLLQGISSPHIELHNDVPAQAIPTYALQPQKSMCSLQALSILCNKA